MASIDRLGALQNALLQTCEQADFKEGTALDQVHLLLKLTGQQLGTSRASTWEFNTDRTRILCQCLYDADADQYDSGMVLSVDDLPAYFEAMSKNRVIVANDARRHPATAEFTDNYLVPLDIYSMVDTPIYSSDSQHGVLCIEQKQQLREWSVDEVAFIISVADKLSLALEHHAWLRATETANNAQRTDTLTGLENRLAFQARLEDCVNCLSKADCGNDRAIVVVGVDNFSVVNDTLGYSQANEVLKVIAEKLSDKFNNKSISPARLFGDMFALWIPRLKSPRYLIQIIEQTLSIFDNPLRLPSGKSIEISACIGGATVPASFKDAVNPVRRAEIALEKAKANGAGSYAIFEDQWLSEYQQKRSREQELLEALSNKELIPYYQPIIEAKTGRVAGMEALARWNHPTKGILAPFHFLPLATEMRIMPQLDELMIRRVFDDIGQHPQVKSLTWIAVNLSSEQLFSNSLVSMLSSLLAEHEIPKNLVELEIVEELISHDTRIVTEQLQAIGALGIKLSIDDFGTGYSSLSRLKHLPVSKLKIDKSFVDGLPSDESDCCIASSIVGMAKGLGINLVAEGVETQEQARWLTDQACDYLQGYLYAKPMPLDQLIDFINKNNKQRTKIS